MAFPDTSGSPLALSVIVDPASVPALSAYIVTGVVVPARNADNVPPDRGTPLASENCCTNILDGENVAIL